MAERTPLPRADPRRGLELGPGGDIPYRAAPGYYGRTDLGSILTPGYKADVNTLGAIHPDALLQALGLMLTTPDAAERLSPWEFQRIPPRENQNL